MQQHSPTVPLTHSCDKKCGVWCTVLPSLVCGVCGSMETDTPPTATGTREHVYQGESGQWSLNRACHACLPPPPPGASWSLVARASQRPPCLRWRRRCTARTAHASLLSPVGSADAGQRPRSRSDAMRICAQVPTQGDEMQKLQLAVVVFLFRFQTHKM